MLFREAREVGMNTMLQLHVWSASLRLFKLRESFDRYFPTKRYSILNDKRLIQNPFEFEGPESLLELTLSPAESDGLIVILLSEYPVLSRASISIFLYSFHDYIYMRIGRFYANWEVICIIYILLLYILLTIPILLAQLNVEKTKKWAIINVQISYLWIPSNIAGSIALFFIV